MSKILDKHAIDILSSQVVSLKSEKFDIIHEAIGDARVVLLGEATHGTEEFYQYRADLTKSLIQEKGFNVVLFEADFPAFYKVNQYVGGAHESELRDLPSNIMDSFKERFPIWMWNNQVMKTFIEDVKHLNKGHTDEHKVSLLGMDIYSLFHSAEEVLKYLEKVDPELGKVVADNYGTIGSYSPDAFEYTNELYQGRVDTQSTKVSKVLTDLLKKEDVFSKDQINDHEFFSASENAYIVKAAEAYYRKAYIGGSVTWNLRDQSMVDIISHAIKYKAKITNRSLKDIRVVVWAHNSHVGDSGATEHAITGQTNVGKLSRERFGVDNVLILGFSMYSGSVRAALHWDGPDYEMEVIPGCPESYEHVFHQVSINTSQDRFGFLLKTKKGSDMDDHQSALEILKEPRLERFIGVQYVKATERQSHYCLCNIVNQFDMLIHFDKTTALRV